MLSTSEHQTWVQVNTRIQQLNIPELELTADYVTFINQIGYMEYYEEEKKTDPQASLFSCQLKMMECYDSQVFQQETIENN